MKLRLTRLLFQDKQTLGILRVIDATGKILFECKTLELADLNNAPQKSCIPLGRYKVSKRVSKKYGLHLHIQDVPNRSFILIHAGNYYTQILGCVLVGSAYSDINKDGYQDVINSKLTLKAILELVPTLTEIEITTAQILA